MKMKFEKVPTMDVDDLVASIQRFSWPDYAMFVLSLGICLAVGIYFGIFAKTKNAQEYLVGSRSMSVFPITMSLTASWVSGISLLGTPTEIYVYGTQYIYIIGGVLLATIFMSWMYLPVFHDLNLTSMYEYHERRFDKKVRLFASILFAIGMISWLPVVIYVPALAFNQVTGVNVHLITPIVCTICIIYTSMGGIKAVVWTDVIQIIIMFGAMILIAIKGTWNLGGIGEVLRRNWSGQRIEGPVFDPNPLTRHTIWSLIIGGCVYLLQNSGIDQNMLQRYMSLPTLKDGRKALWGFFFGLSGIVLICSYCGMILYATYYKCDPLTTGLAKQKDQLLPLLVVEVLGDFPGLPGIFIAGIFSAALSSLSTGLNAMAAVVLEDFYKPFFKRSLTNKQTLYVMRITVIIFGTICLGMVYVIEKLGTVLQLTLSMGAVASGPSLGLSTMGVFLPWVNAKGALAGSITSLISLSWICYGAQSMIAAGTLTFQHKPVSTEECNYHFMPKPWNTTTTFDSGQEFSIYRVSYLWYTMIGVLIAVPVGLVVSFLTTPLDPNDVDPKLLTPLVRKFFKPKKCTDETKYGETFDLPMQKQ
ncbi:unnamed protein product [Acanthoscelides obtectus]|uniref:Sodium-coupled monocarboxylate transporter 1 n=3 Tax=Acanthoscelides obtectus TaxID=200917 RepID=A0A9P0PKN8_ACAOB|nr:unnamed protein product [Acanthoscelides obtectus]CAK1642073.1 Sodium-coupled monocarboxylate transporter 1 [Acanthoscelides obtectus]